MLHKTANTEVSPISTRLCLRHNVFVLEKRILINTYFPCKLQQAYGMPIPQLPMQAHARAPHTSILTPCVLPWTVSHFLAVCCEKCRAVSARRHPNARSNACGDKCWPRCRAPISDATPFKRPMACPSLLALVPSKPVPLPTDP